MEPYAADAILKLKKIADDICYNLSPIFICSVYEFIAGAVGVKEVRQLNKHYDGTCVAISRVGTYHVMWQYNFGSCSKCDPDTQLEAKINLEKSRGKKFKMVSDDLSNKIKSGRVFTSVGALKSALYCASYLSYDDLLKLLSK